MIENSYKDRKILDRLEDIEEEIKLTNREELFLFPIFIILCVIHAFYTFFSDDIFIMICLFVFIRKSEIYSKNFTLKSEQRILRLLKK